MEPKVVHIVIKDKEAEEDLEKLCKKWDGLGYGNNLYADSEQSLDSWKKEQ